jgi:hypothetical protein
LIEDISEYIIPFTHFLQYYTLHIKLVSEEKKYKMSLKKTLNTETNKYIKGLAIQITMFGVIDGLCVIGTDK